MGKLPDYHGLRSEPQASILLVDDNPANLLYLRTVLADLDQNLVELSSGEEAIPRAQQEEFAVILLDVLMPGINGFETARAIRAGEQSKNTPIIFITGGNVDRSQMEQAYELGAVDFLVKPVLPIAIQAKVRSFVQIFEDKQRARQEADQLRLLVHGTTDYAIFMLEPDGRIASWNAGAERIKGYSADEIIGQHFSRFYPQEALDRCWPEHELTVAAAEGRFEDEGWRIRKDGSRFWANVVITALRGERGELRGFSKVTRDLTARKSAEESLRQIEERFRLLIENATDYAIFVLDTQGYVATWNAGAERIKGYKADEIIGQHFSRFYPTEANDRGWPAHELQVATKEGRFEDEGWRVRKDGTQFWGNVVITALKDEHGNLRGFSKITRDMTERKASEENARRLAEESTARRMAEESARQIQEQRERLHVTLASIGDAFISTDAEGRVEFLNSVAEELVGWKNAEAVGLPLVDVFRIVNEDSRLPVDNPALRALREGVVVGLANHTILIARNGEEHPIDDSAAPIRNAAGAVVGCVLVFRDVSEQRQAAQAAHRNQELLRLIHKIGRIGHWEWNSVTDENNWSPEIEALYGLPPGGFEGGYQGWAKLLHPEDLSRAEEDVRRAMETGEYFSEFRVIWPDGSIHWLETRAHVFKDAHGRPERIMGVNMDITERKQQEAALLESEQRFRGLMEQAPFSVQVFTPDGATVRVNEAWEKLWGISLNQISDYNPLEDPQLAAKGITPFLRKAFEGEATSIPAIEYDVNETLPDRTRHVDSRRWVSAVAYPLKDEAGTIHEVVLVHDDITARKRAEDEVHRGRARQSFVVTLADTLRPLSDPIAVQAEASRLLGEYLGANRVVYFEVRDDDYVIEQDYTANVQPLAGRYPVSSFGDRILSTLLAGHTVVESDATTEPSRTLAERIAFEGIQVRGHVDVPLVKEGRFVAGLTVHVSAARDWTANEVALIEEVAERTWAAVERTRAESAVRSSEHKYRTLFDSMDEGYCVIEMIFDAADQPFDYRFVELNPAFVKHTGLTSAVGRTMREFAPNMEQFWFDTYGRVARTGEPTRFTNEAKAMGRWYDVYAFRLGGEGSNRVAALFNDITEKMRGVEQRQAIQKTLSDLVELCPFGIYIVDDDFRIASVNTRSQDKAFANVRPLIGHPFDDAMRILWSEEIAADVIANFRHTLDTGEPYYSRDFVNPRADIDQTEGYEWELHRITLPSGRHGVVCYYYDATKLRQVEQALKDADRRKDEFLATLAHELRNPLAPIRNALHLLKLTTDPASWEQARGMMDRQLTQMVRLVDDLMDISRISRNKLALRKTPVELSAVVQSAVETARPQIEAGGHTLTVTLPPKAIHLDADLTRLAQVFWNILNNSAKYTEPGGRISLVAEMQGDEAVVTVQDNGIGLAAESLPGLFEMFSQVDQSMERSQGGLGIGLALVKGLTEAHGGKVEAASGGIGKGSTFIVRLPVTGQASRISSPDTKVTPPPPKSRILIVDDNRDGAASLAMLLSFMGYETRTAHDGLEGIAQADAFRPDLIVLDIGLPKLNGYDACRKIREHAWAKNTLIVAATGWGQDEDRRRSHAAGFDHHLVKPVDATELNRMLAEKQA